MFRYSQVINRVQPVRGRHLLGNFQICKYQKSHHLVNGEYTQCRVICKSSSFSKQLEDLSNNSSEPSKPALKGPQQQNDVKQILDSVFQNGMKLSDYLVLIVASAYTMGTAFAVQGVPQSYLWSPALLGTILGLHFALCMRFSRVRLWLQPKSPLNVVIMGGSRGIGKAIAREFIASGDRVFITARSKHSVNAAIAELTSECGEHTTTGDNRKAVSGTICDVSSPTQIKLARNHAIAELGHVDMWVNIAGFSGGYTAFSEIEYGDIVNVVKTNLTGALLSTKAAIQTMAEQEKGGHVFVMDGAGSDQQPTPFYASYGATKSAVAHMVQSVAREAQELRKADGSKANINLHTISPGMVLTNLLLQNATVANKQMFNILCEQPETVAAFLVPRMKTVVARNQNLQYIKYLTAAKAVARFLSAPVRVGKFFDTEGNKLYPNEQTRLKGYASKTTARLARSARNRSSKLQLAYAFSMVVGFVLLSGDAMMYAANQ